MTKPIAPQPTDYVSKLRAWKRAAVEWLGLDPESVMDVDLTEEPRTSSFGAVRWEALTRDEPTRGIFERFDLHWTEGAPVVYTGFGHLDYEEGSELYAAIGPEPEFMSAADETRLRSALGDRI